ncbi:hypothetical protein F5050DRAFT_1579705, partial [Lentinula boryana]
GYTVLFFPNYHCELNSIEQCWGYAKRVYPISHVLTSSSETNLEKNILVVLDSIPLVSMQRFATHSLHFANGYALGLNGAEAAWANKKFWGHRTIPPIFEQK